MNREIKFRAWDKGKKFMIPNVQAVYDGHPDEKWNNKIYETTGCTCDAFNSFLENDDFEVMQFTGAEDKNGKEIYEGDIVTFEINNFSYVGEIKFEAGTFIIGCDEIDDSYISLIDLGIEEDSLWKVRIMGNIYENKELLEEKNQNEK